MSATEPPSQVQKEVDLDAVSAAMAGRPVFVVGCPRSGTTLVRLIVDSHPSLAIPPETRFLVPVAGDARSSDWTGREAAARLIAQPGFARLGLAAELYEHAVAELRPPDTASAIRLLFSLYATVNNKARWGEKTPIQVFYLPMLSSLFPDAQFLHVIRDGREVAASLAEMDWGPHSLLGAAFIWRSAVQKARRDGAILGRSRYMEMKLEQIVANTEAAAKAFCDFIGEPFDPAMLAYHETAAERTSLLYPGAHSNTTRPPTTGLRDWRAGRSDQELLALQVYLHDRLAEFGYPVGTFSARERAVGMARAYGELARCSPRIAGVVHARTGRHSTVLSRLGGVAEKVRSLKR